MEHWEDKTQLVKKFSYLDDWASVLKESGWQFVTLYAPTEPRTN